MAYVQMEANKKTSINFMGRTKLKVLKALILIAAVIYLYYCVFYSIYLFLLK